MEQWLAIPKLALNAQKSSALSSCEKWNDKSADSAKTTPQETCFSDSFPSIIN